MQPAELKSYKFKIESSNGHGVGKLIKEIFSNGEFPCELVPSIIKVLKESGYVLSEAVCDVIVSTKSEELYEILKTKKYLTEWDLIKLMRVGYPDPEIEKILCESLYKIFRNVAEPRRNYIVEAMQKSGTEKSLDVLEAIEFELMPLAQARKLATSGAKEMTEIEYGNWDHLIYVAESESLVGFYELVKETKSILVRRMNSIVNETFANNKNELVDKNAEDQGICDRLLTLENRAKNYIKNDPESALNQARKAAEAICKEIYIRHRLEDHNKPANRQTLDELISSLKRKDLLPKQIILHLNNIRDLGNFGSHDQGVESYEISPATAQPCLGSLDVIIKWFKESFFNS